MKIGKVFFAFMLVIILILGIPTASRARVMLTADTNGIDVQSYAHRYFYRGRLDVDTGFVDVNHNEYIG